MYTLAKFLQALGLVVVAYALFYGLSGGGQRGVAAGELGIMAGGVLLFLIGRKIEPEG